MTNFKEKIREIQDFPIKGINFKDITTLLLDPKYLNRSIRAMYEQYQDKNIDLVAGIESRGFIFGTPLACMLGVGFVPIRKPGKLPAETISKEYKLEYGTNEIEIHKDSIKEGQRIVLVDDLLATGGTMVAATELIEELQGEIVGISFLIELIFLNGREKLKNYNIHSLVNYE